MRFNEEEKLRIVKEEKERLEFEAARKEAARLKAIADAEEARLRDEALKKAED